MLLSSDTTVKDHGTFKVALSEGYIMTWSQACWGQEADCGGLNENGPHRLMFGYLAPS